jgi:hypothetical protein
MCVVTVKRWKGFQHVMLNMDIQFSFEVKWSEVSYCEVLRGKSTMYNTTTLYWVHLIVFWLFHLVCILNCGCCNWFCNVWVCVGGGGVVLIIVWVFMFCSPCILRKFVEGKPTWCNKFLKYIYLSITLYMFRALCAHHQERSNCTNTNSALFILF